MSHNRKLLKTTENLFRNRLSDFTSRVVLRLSAKETAVCVLSRGSFQTHALEAFMHSQMEFDSGSTGLGDVHEYQFVLS